MTKGNEGSDPKENADVPPVLPSEKQPSSSSSRSRGALSPEDLDFTDSPYVDEIDDGRYVVSADRRPPSGSSGTQTARNATQSQASANASSTQQTTPNTHGGSGDSTDPGAHGGGPATSESDPTDPAPTESQPAATSLETPQHDSSAPQSTQPPQEPPRPQSPEAARSLLASELEHVETRYAIDIVSRFGDETARHRTASDDAVGTFNSLLFWYARHVSGRTPTNRAAELLLEKSDFTPALSKRQVERAMRTHDLDGSSSLDELCDALE